MRSHSVRTSPLKNYHPSLTSTSSTIDDIKQLSQYINNVSKNILRVDNALNHTLAGSTCDVVDEKIEKDHSSFSGHSINNPYIRHSMKPNINKSLTQSICRGFDVLSEEDSFQKLNEPTEVKNAAKTLAEKKIITSYNEKETPFQKEPPLTKPRGKTVKVKPQTKIIKKTSSRNVNNFKEGNKSVLSASFSYSLNGSKHPSIYKGSAVVSRKHFGLNSTFTSAFNASSARGRKSIIADKIISEFNTQKLGHKTQRTSTRINSTLKRNLNAKISSVQIANHPAKVKKENFSKISTLKHVQYSTLNDMFILLSQLNTLSAKTAMKKSEIKYKFPPSKPEDKKGPKLIQTKWREHYLKKKILPAFNYTHLTKSQHLEKEEMILFSKMCFFKEVLENENFKELVETMNKVNQLYSKCMRNKKFIEMKKIICGTGKEGNDFANDVATISKAHIKLNSKKAPKGASIKKPSKLNKNL